MSVGDWGAASICARGSSAKPGHLRAKACFINEDEACWIEVELPVEPVLATLQEVRTLLFHCMCSHCLKVQPRFRSQTSSALRPIDTALSSRNRMTISLRGNALRLVDHPEDELLMGHQGASRRVGPASNASADLCAHSQSRRSLSKCQSQIGPLLNAPTCHSVTQPARGYADHR